MNVTITITGDLNDAALILQSLANCTPSPRTVDAESFVPKVKAAAVKVLAEAEPVDMDMGEGINPADEELPVEPPKVPKPPRKPKAEKIDKAVVGAIPSAPKAVKADAAPATRDGAKLAMEKFVKAHGTLDLAKRMGAFGGARRLTDIPDDKLDEFVKAIEV